MNLRQKLKDNPLLGNAVLVGIGILFVSSLSTSGGNPAGFFKAMLGYLGGVVVAIVVVAAVVALGIRLGGNAQGAVAVQQQKQNQAKRHKPKKK